MGFFLGAAFMLMVGSVIFLIIMDIPKKHRILAKGLLIVGFNRTTYKNRVKLRTTVQEYSLVHLLNH